MRLFSACRSYPHSILVGLVFLLPSCTPESENPLSDPDRAKVDERLFGIWHAKDKDGNNHYCFIGKTNRKDTPPGLMTIDGVTFRSDLALETSGIPSYFFSTTIGGEYYANLVSETALDQKVFPKWDKGNVKSYGFAKYTLEGDRLTYWYMSDSAAEKAIEKGLVKGKVIEAKKNMPRSIILTDTTANLTTWLEIANGKELFPDKNKLVYKRVRLDER